MGIPRKIPLGIPMEIHVGRLVEILAIILPTGLSKGIPIRTTTLFPQAVLTLLAASPTRPCKKELPLFLKCLGHHF